MSQTSFPDRKEIITSHSSIIEEIKSLDVQNVNFSDTDFKPRTKIVEEQKVYFWIRVYLKHETQINPDTKVLIKYLPSGEQLETKFICYAKKGADKNLDENVINYNPEDDRRILCLMIDSEKINKNSEDIPFIRTMFRISKWYSPQILRHSELEVIDSTGKTLDYFDIDF